MSKILVLFFGIVLLWNTGFSAEKYQVRLGVFGDAAEAPVYVA
jgi:hypothetical protein